MEKQFSVTLRVNGRVADVVAEVGAFADYLEGKFGAGISGMTVDTTVHGWNEPQGIVVGTRPAPEFTPPPEPEPTPAKRTRKAKAPEPTAPETGPFSPAEVAAAATTVLAAIPEAEAAAEPQAEIEGADVEAEAAPAPQPELTRDDVFEALRRLVTTKGNDAAVAALASVGAKKFSDVPTPSLPALYAAIQKVLA